MEFVGERHWGQTPAPLLFLQDSKIEYGRSPVSMPPLCGPVSNRSVANRPGSRLSDVWRCDCSRRRAPARSGGARRASDRPGLPHLLGGFPGNRWHGRTTSRLPALPIHGGGSSTTRCSGLAASASSAVVSRFAGRTKLAEYLDGPQNRAAGGVCRSAASAARTDVPAASAASRNSRRRGGRPTSRSAIAGKPATTGKPAITEKPRWRVGPNPTAANPAAPNSAR